MKFTWQLFGIEVSQFEIEKDEPPPKTRLEPTADWVSKRVRTVGTTWFRKLLR
jgi:hypothetical protein